MTFWTYQNLADVTQGTWLVEPDDLNVELTGLWHDTRDIKQGQAYLAIKGDNFDGHAFIEKAFEAGAALAIVQSELPTLEGGAGGRALNQSVLKVTDTVIALQDLARAYRDELKRGGCKVIGIAGSNGKTTTRHLIHHVLSHAGLKGIQSPKSFNNHLGVPLTLLSGKPQDDFVACEIGTNHPGEIDFLSAIARPDIAVITSIGEEHLEFFKDLEGVADEESSVLEYVEPNGVAITPGIWDYEHRFDLHPKWLNRLTRTAKNIRVGEHQFEPDFSNQFDEWYTGNISNNVIAPQQLIVWETRPNGYEEKLIDCELNISGQCNIFNATTAFVVARQFDLASDTLKEAFRSFVSAMGRVQIHNLPDIRVINDAYNANPSSMREAIAMMATNQENHNASSVLILGDMYELGDQSRELHRGIGRYLAPMDSDYIGTKCQSVSRVILIGVMMQHARGPIETAWTYKADSRLHCFPEWSDDLPNKIAALLQPGDTVLLKASRGMQLERLIPAIERRFGAVTEDEPK